jgi:hypothetical protein
MKEGVTIFVPGADLAVCTFGEASCSWFDWGMGVVGAIPSVNVELPMNEFRVAKRSELKERLVEATNTILKAVAAKYDLPYGELSKTLR